jgi:putative SOS response-associated peptidase YedK
MPPRYNAAPTQDFLVVRFNPKIREHTLDALRWGLVPWWTKDTKIGLSSINAKAETVSTKPAFRDAFKRADASCQLTGSTSGSSTRRRNSRTSLR